jgi:hypothetical protein
MNDGVAGRTAENQTTGRKESDMWKVKAILEKARADAAAATDDHARHRIWTRAWRNVGSIILPTDSPPESAHTQSKYPGTISAEEDMPMSHDQDSNPRQ